VTTPETTVQGLKTSLALFQQPALAKYVRRVVLPDGFSQSDEDLRNFVRNNCRTSYHPIGTCRMGADDESVVNTQLKLRGFDGLRICDSSVFSSLIGSNTNATTVMLAEKASDLIADDETTYSNPALALA
jgi:choline dehydrogenase-like flavoprotein